MNAPLLAERAEDVRASVSPAALRRRLLHWYRRRGRRLPWRGTHDPYRVWVSEVMLQQTQVATAIPFYQRFLARFPDLSTLARAREPQVLAAWSGLGYYRRARNLLAAARQVVRDYDARVPDDPAEFGRLPGVGRYTAGAVLSIAFGRRLPVVDGNVARVLSRIYALEAAIRDPRGAKALWDLADSLVPVSAPGDWNQALMELGATVCLPRAPECAKCPIRSMCRAFSLGRVDAYPPATARRETVQVRRVVAMIERHGKLLMVRANGPLLDGLWEPPWVEPSARGSERAGLAAECARLGLSVRLARTRHRIRHAITHRRIEAEVWRGELLAPPRRTAGVRFVDPEASGVAVSGFAKKVGRVREALARQRPRRIVGRPTSR